MASGNDYNKRVYDGLKEKGLIKNLDYDGFLTKLDDPTYSKKIYDGLKTMGGIKKLDYDGFQQKVGAVSGTTGGIPQQQSFSDVPENLTVQQMDSISNAENARFGTEFTTSNQQQQPKEEKGFWSKVGDFFVQGAMNSTEGQMAQRFEAEMARSAAERQAEYFESLYKARQQSYDGARERLYAPIVREKNKNALDNVNTALDKEIEQQYEKLFKDDPYLLQNENTAAVALFTAKRGLRSKEGQLLQTAQDRLEENKKLIDAAVEGKGFWAGLGNTAGDFDNWTMGLSEYYNNKNVRAVIEKADKGEELTKAEQAVMDAVALETMAHQYYAYQLSRMYKAGETTGASLPFMVDFMINPIAGTGKTLAKAAMKWGVKRGLAKGTRYAVQVGARLGGDILGATGMTLTTGAGRVAAGTEQRMTGDVMSDISYDRERGTYNINYNGRENQQTFGTALWNSAADQWVENYSEMALNVFNHSGKMVERWIKQSPLNGLFNAKGVEAFKHLWSAYDKLQERAQFHGYLGEVSEEYFGNLLRLAVTTDTKAEDVFSADAQIDTWLGLAPTSVAFALLGMGGRGINKYNKYKAGKEAYANYLSMLTPQERATFDIVRQHIENGDTDFAKDYVKEIARDYRLTPQQKQDRLQAVYATLYDKQYADFKGAMENEIRSNLDALYRTRVGSDGKLTFAFLNGNPVSVSRQNDNGTYHIIDADGNESDVDGSTLTDIESHNYDEFIQQWTTKQLLTDIVERRFSKGDKITNGEYEGEIADFDGNNVTIRFADNTTANVPYSEIEEDWGFVDEKKMDSAAAETDKQTNETNGHVTNVRIGGESATFYVKSGNLAVTTSSDGKPIIDKGQSDKVFTVVNAETGEATQVGIERIAEVLGDATAQEIKEQSNEAIRQASYNERNYPTGAIVYNEQMPNGLTSIVSTDENGIGIQSLNEQTGQIEQTNIPNEQRNTWRRLNLEQGNILQTQVSTIEIIENKGADGYIVSIDGAQPQQIGAQQLADKLTAEQFDVAAYEAQYGKVEQEQQQAEQPQSEQQQPEQPQQPEQAQAQAEQQEEGAEFSDEDVNATVTDIFRKLQKQKELAAKPISLIDEKAVAKRKAAQQEIERLQQLYDYWDGIKQRRDEQKTAAAKQRKAEDEAERQRREAEKAAKAEAERIEREKAQGVPDVSRDNAIDARKRGYRIESGRVIERQLPVKGIYGNSHEVMFSTKDKPLGRVKVVEAEALQPSHINGARNNRYFITEAQPKERTDKASQMAAEKIAQNIIPQQITEGTTAYQGAPVINTRGEVIQGNNRTTALQKMYDEFPDQAAIYKQYLIDNAEKFGLNADEIAAMERPVLTTELNVSDEEAIRLGQKNAQDTESGGRQRIDSEKTAQMLGNKLYNFAQRLTQSNDEEMPLTDVIGANGKTALKFLNTQGIINETQYQSAFDKNGNLTPEAKSDLLGVLENMLFAGAKSDRIKEMFSTLPQPAQKAILQTIARDAENSNDAKVAPYLQEAIEAYYSVKDDEVFLAAKTLDERMRAIDSWARQSQMDFAGNAFFPVQKYSNFALALAATFKSQTMATQRAKYNELYDKLQGKGANLFGEAETLSFVEAVERVYNIKLNRENKQDVTNDGSNVLAHGSEPSSTGQPRSAGGTRSTEPTAAGERTTDHTAGTATDNEQSTADVGKTTPNQPIEIGESAWGKVFQWVKGKAVEAAHYLKNLQSGYLKGVFFRKGLGDIDLFWGNEKGGLAHIIDKHIIKHSDFPSIETAIETIDDVISTGKIIQQPNGRIALVKDGNRVVIERTLEGSWVVTAFDETKKLNEKKRSEEDATRLHQDIFEKENGELVSPNSASSTDKGTTNNRNDQTFDKKKDGVQVENAPFPNDNTPIQSVKDLAARIDDTLGDISSVKVGYLQALNLLAINKEAGKEFLKQNNITTQDGFAAWCKKRQAKLRKGTNQRRREALAQINADRILDMAQKAESEFEQKVEAENSKKESEQTLLSESEFVAKKMEEAFASRKDKTQSREDFDMSDEATDIENAAIDSYADYIKSLLDSGKMQELYDNSTISERIKIARAIETAGFEIDDYIDKSKINSEAKRKRDEQKRKKVEDTMRAIGLNSFVEKMTGKGVNLVQDARELPRSEGTAYRAIKSGAKVMGWFNVKTGQVYIYTPNANNYNEVMRTLLHEFVSHKGLRDMLGTEAFDKLCHNVWKMMPFEQRVQFAVYVTQRIPVGTREIQKYIEQLSPYDIATMLGSEKTQLAAADEYMAHFAEKGVTEQNRSIWQQIADAIRKMLRKIGFDVPLQDSDIARLLYESKNRLTQDMTLEEMAEATLKLNTPTNGFGASEQKANDNDTRFSISSYSPEQQSIRDKAIANGTFMKAPNGKPTKLNERQWLQVRTRAFKNWFGDWEKAAQAKYLLGDNYVKVLAGTEFQKDETPITKKVAQYYNEKYNGRIERKNFGEVILDERSVKDSIAHGIGRTKSAAFAAVPEIIRDGIEIDTQENWKGRNRDSFTFAAPVEIGEKAYVGVVIVTRGAVKGDNRFYLHEVILQENLQSERIKTDNKADAHNGDIAKVLKNIVSASENASKIVDENGEPLVVYHGTPYAGFSEFDNNEAGIYFSNIDRASWYTGGIDNPQLFRFAPKFNSWNTVEQYATKNDILFAKADKEEYGENAYNVDGVIVDTIQEAEEIVQDVQNRRQNAGNIYAVFLNIRNPKYKDAKGKHAVNYDQLSHGKKYDGVIIENINDPTFDEGSNFLATNYIALSPNQIKSATDNNGSFDESSDDIRFSISNANNDIFYSNAERAVENIKQEKATPQQWLAMIEKNGGLKAGEDKWIGLSDWLKEQDQKTLTKQEVIDFISSNKIQIEETHYSETTGQELLEQYQPEFTQYYQEAEQEGADDPQEAAWQRMTDEYGDDFGLGFYAVGRTLYANEDGDYLSYLADQEGTDRPINETRLRYSTQGLENKHEIALTVPTIESWDENDLVHFGDANNGRVVAWVRFGDTTIDGDATQQREAYNKLSSEWNAYRDMLHSKYGDTYSAIAQNATEAELNEYDRLTSELEQARDAYMNHAKQNVLVIDEIQSNRHQQGREKGYQQKGAENTNDAIPAAPFEKNWHELAMKRILRFAAENGYDKLAWTTGAQQAERYDIGTAVEKITVEPLYGGGKELHIYKADGHYDVMEADTNGNITNALGDYSNLNGKSITDVFGKEIGRKIAETEGKTTLAGNDLRIGGEGMKGFYDDILPRFMQKYGKKWGVQVGEVTMPQLQEGYQTMHAIDINDAMRESVMAGQPMFRIASNESESANAEFNQRLDELIANPTQKDRVLHLGKTSQFLKDGGISDAEIILDFDRLVKKAEEAYENHHPFELKDVKDLPKAISEPIAVFYNTNNNGHNVVLTELQKDGNNFIVAIETQQKPRKGGVVLEINEIITLFPKDARGIINWFNVGNATNIDKEKALRFIEALRNHRETTITSEELDFATKVVKDFENPKFDDSRFSIDGGVEGSVAPEALPQELVGNIAPSENITEFAARLNATMNGYTQERTQQMYDEVEKRMRKGGRWYAKLYKHLYDKYRPLDRLQQILAKQGALLDVQTDAYNDIFRSIGRASTAFEEFYEKQFKPLIHLVRKLEQLDAIKNFDDVRWADGKKMTDHDKLTLYLRAKDMVEAAELGLVERGAEGFADMVRHNGFTRTHTGSWTPQEYVAAFEEALGEPNVNALWNKVNAINQWSLDYMRNNDFIDDETLERYKDRKFYVPQRGFEEGESKPARNGRGSNNFGSALRKAHGRESLAADPLVYMANIAESTIMATQKNKTKQKMLLFCMANMRLGKETGTFDIVKTQYRKTGRILENGLPEYEPFYGTIPYDELKEDAHNRREIARKKQQLVEAEAMGNVYFQEQLKEDIAALEAKTKYAASVRYDQIRPDTQDNVSRQRVDVIYKGKKYSLLFADENVAAALNREDPEMGKVTKFLNTTLPFIPATTQYFSRILTQQNPSFALWNLFRDMGLGFHTNLLEHPTWTLAFSKNLVAVQRAVAQKAFANKIDESSKMGKYIQEYFAEGAQTGYSFINSVDDLRKKIAKDLKRSERYADYLDSNLNAFKLFSNITEWSELTVRVAQYVTAREHGYTPEQAATEAKEVSTNFDRKGNLRLLYSLFSFFNAAMQGTNKHIRQVMNGHGKGLALSLALYAGAGFLNTLLMPDDPDDEMGFSEFDRMQNICLGRVRIPLPQGLRGFWALGVQAALAIQGRKTWLASAVDGASFLAAELGPINPLGGLEVDNSTNRLKVNSKLAFREFVPTAAQPLYDVANNTTFNGSTVYRTPYVASQEGKIPQTNLAKRNVNALLQRATDKWFEIGGGDPSKNTLTRTDGTQVRSMFDVNPSKVEYLLKSATGGVGQFAVDLVNTIDNALTKNINSFDDFATTMPVVKRAWKPYKEEKEATRAYWLLKGRVEAASKAAKTMPKDRKAIYDKAKEKLGKKTPAELSSKEDLKEMNAIIVEWNQNYW